MDYNGAEDINVFDIEMSNKNKTLRFSLESYEENFWYLTKLVCAVVLTAQKKSISTVEKILKFFSTIHH